LTTGAEDLGDLIVGTAAHVEKEPKIRKVLDGRLGRLCGYSSQRSPGITRKRQTARAHVSISQQIVVSAPAGKTAGIPFVISRSSVQIRTPAPHLQDRE
jgi:hypothetical protein